MYKIGLAVLFFSILIVTQASAEDAYIKIISPIGGESLSFGENYIIKWESSPNIQKVSIGLSPCDSCLDWISFSTENDGTYEWNVSKLGWYNKSDFKIELTGYGELIDNGNPRVKSGEFKILPENMEEERFLKILRPNGRETLRSNQIYRIEWEKSGDVPKISIGLSRKSESKEFPDELRWIINNIPNTGYYEWNISNKPYYDNSDYKLFISNGGYDEGPYGDYSDDYFKILTYWTSAGSPANGTNAPTTTSCTETDGGINYDKKGFLTGTEAGSPSKVEDSCQDANILREFYCGENPQGNRWNYAWENYYCEFGCANAACKKYSLEESTKVIGSVDGGIMFEVYTDFQDPFSAKWYNEIYPKLYEMYVDQGKIFIVFRHYPFLSADSMDRAIAVECANRQSHFQDVMDALYNDLKTDTDLEYYRRSTASLRNFDFGKFEACFTSRETEYTVNKELKKGTSAGVNAVPTFFIGSEKILGSYDIGEFKRVIDSVLANPDKLIKNTSQIAGGDGEGCLEYDDVGSDPYVSGYVRSPKNGQYDSISDYCVDDRTLKEYFCDGKGNIGNSEYPCGLGCKHGLCLQSECDIVGIRDDGKYCTIDKEWDAQKNTDEPCENNFECSSNVCVNSKCVSGSLIDKILAWFKSLFGSD